jgi:NTP pyrophosphatase (non-canonical NTP hydrolase)
MNLNDYQTQAMSSAIFPDQYKILYPALKLAGESGEVAEKIGKVLRDGDGNFDDLHIKDTLAYELGDVLWYVAALAHSLGYSLEDIAQMNITKLADRKARNKISGSGDYR